MSGVLLQRWPDRKYLVSYDPNWQPDPLPAGAKEWECGVSEWTDDPHQAKVFKSTTEALDFWNQTSTKHPRRGDGRPNKPLTRYSIEVVSAPPPRSDDGDPTTAPADQG